MNEWKRQNERNRHKNSGQSAHLKQSGSASCSVMPTLRAHVHCVYSTSLIFHTRTHALVSHNAHKPLALELWLYLLFFFLLLLVFCSFFILSLMSELKLYHTNIVRYRHTHVINTVKYNKSHFLCNCTCSQTLNKNINKIALISLFSNAYCSDFVALLFIAPYHKEILAQSVIIIHWVPIWWSSFCMLVEHPGITSARLDWYEIVRNTWRKIISGALALMHTCSNASTIDIYCTQTNTHYTYENT